MYPVYIGVSNVQRKYFTKNWVVKRIQCLKKKICVKIILKSKNKKCQKISSYFLMIDLYTNFHFQPLNPFNFTVNIGQANHWLPMYNKGCKLYILYNLFYQAKESSRVNTVFIQFSFCRRCRFIKPLLLSSVETFNQYNPKSFSQNTGPSSFLNAFY